MVSAEANGTTHSVLATSELSTEDDRRRQVITDCASIGRMKITVYRAEDGWRWRARAANGEIVSESGEAYENRPTSWRP
jgi:hypothetical protein